MEQLTLELIKHKETFFTYKVVTIKTTKLQERTNYINFLYLAQAFATHCISKIPSLSTRRV